MKETAAWRGVGGAYVERDAKTMLISNVKALMLLTFRQNKKY